LPKKVMPSKLFSIDETDPSVLGTHFITPANLLYHRSH
jgi:hypothetical protein